MIYVLVIGVVRKIFFFHHLPAEFFDGVSYLGELNSDGKFYRYQTNQGTVTATCSGKIVELDGENPPVGEIPSSNDAIAAAEAAEEAAEDAAPDTEGEDEE